MSDANTQTNATPVSNVVLATVKSDPIAWAKKGNKIVYGNVNELLSDALKNIRFAAGSTVYGVEVKRDTYDLPSMKLSISEVGYIHTPILVSVRANGDKITLQGNRRVRAGQELLADGSISAELRMALTSQTPMILLTGLTPQQEDELVFDQTQKRFLRSECIRHVFQMRAAGKTYDQIASVMWEPMGQFSGNAKKVADIRDIVDPVLKSQKIRTWLRGSLDCYLIWGYDLGEWTRKQIMLSEMAVDGLIGTNDEKPYVILTKNSQKRIAALKKAKEADGSKFNGFVLVDGSEFKKVADAFHQEDYGIAILDPKPEVKKMLDRKSVESLRDSRQSKLAKSAFNRVLGQDASDLTTLDETAAILESKQMLVEMYLPRLKPEVAALVRTILVNPDPTDFQAWLDANVTEETPTPTENVS